MNPEAEEIWPTAGWLIFVRVQGEVNIVMSGSCGIFSTTEPEQRFDSSSIAVVSDSGNSQNHMSLPLAFCVFDQLLSSAAAEKLSALMTVEHLRERARRAKREGQIVLSVHSTHLARSMYQVFQS